jgi:hypothetical protein
MNNTRAIVDDGDSRIKYSDNWKEVSLSTTYLERAMAADLDFPVPVSVEFSMSFDFTGMSLRSAAFYN